MAFNFGALSATYPWPDGAVVTYADEKGKTVRDKFTPIFNRLNKDENKGLAQVMMAYQRAMEANEDLDDLPDDREIADRVLAGWKGVTNDGEEMPYTEENKALLLNSPAFVSAVVRAYFESIEPAKAKN